MSTTLTGSSYYKYYINAAPKTRRSSMNGDRYSNNSDNSRFEGQLARLDEKVKSTDDKVSSVQKNIDRLTDTFDKYEERLDENFVSRLEYEPVKKLVYGAVSFILITVLGAFMVLVVKSNNISGEVKATAPTMQTVK
jgi:predicted nuclease with TOPRIM domain